jgi:hypothetical protein
MVHLAIGHMGLYVVRSTIPMMWQKFGNPQFREKLCCVRIVLFVQYCVMHRKMHFSVVNLVPQESETFCPDPDLDHKFSDPELGVNL